MFCGCSNTTRHLLYLLSTEITEKEDFELAQKCLSTTTGTATETETHGEDGCGPDETPDGIDLINDGELEALFKEEDGDG